MKAVVYYNEDNIRCEDIVKPVIGDGEILVRMKACGICGGDLMHWYRRTKAPLVLGHEITGEVIELGAGVENFKIGDRVFVHHHIACLTCHFCLHGDFIHCSRFSKNRIYPGGFAEYIRVSAPIVNGDVLLLPPAVSYEYGTLIEPLACCIKGIARTGLELGDLLLIIGAGPVGIMNIQLAKRVMGAGTVIVSETLERRRQYAKQFGADIVVDPSKQQIIRVVRDASNGVGADAVMVNVSNVPAIQQGLEAVRNGGVVVIFAPPAPEESLTLNSNELFFTEKKIVSSYTASHQETRQALKLLESNTVDLKGIITHGYEMENAADAFREAEQREALKVVITNAGAFTRLNREKPSRL